MDRVCETCDTKSANNQVDGVWLCVDCIVETNTALLKTNGSGKPVAETPQGVIMKAPIANARALVRTMSAVMEKLLAGEMDSSTAIAICKVSGETLKALDLIWRMTSEKNL